MIMEIAITGIVAVTSIIALRILTQTGSRRAYTEALRVKDDIIKDLKGEVYKWRARTYAAVSPPYGAEGIEDITSKLPKWARPLAAPVMEWAKTEEGQTTIKGLIDKYAKKSEGGAEFTDDGV